MSQRLKALLGGIILGFLLATALLSGQCIGYRGGLVRRAEEPWPYWFGVSGLAFTFGVAVLVAIFDP